MNRQQVLDILGLESSGRWTTWVCKVYACEGEVRFSSILVTISGFQVRLTYREFKNGWMPDLLINYGRSMFCARKYIVCDDAEIKNIRSADDLRERFNKIKPEIASWLLCNLVLPER